MEAATAVEKLRWTRGRYEGCGGLCPEKSTPDLGAARNTWRRRWAVGAPGIAFLQVKLVKEGSLEEERLMEGLGGRGELNQEGRQAGTMRCVHREE